MKYCFTGLSRACYFLLLAAFFLTACTDQPSDNAEVAAGATSAKNNDDTASVSVPAPPEPAAKPTTEPATKSTVASASTPVAVEANSENAGNAPGPPVEVRRAPVKAAAAKKSTDTVKGSKVGGMSYSTMAKAATQAASVDKGKLVTADATVIKVTPADSDGDYRKLDVYKVKLGADTQLTVPGSPGELIVWIGSPDVEKRFEIGMVTDESTTFVPAIGETAQVTPHAPDFEVKPEESECIRIHPSGSEVRFELMPKEAGAFEVGASVKLFESNDCSGAPVPKLVENLMVEVVVNEGKLVKQGLGELIKVAWEKFLEFWGALVALVLGLALFGVRDKFKKWFGFE
jgi:hypothetical protein